MIIFRNKNDISDSKGSIKIVIACATLALFLKSIFNSVSILPNHGCLEVWVNVLFRWWETRFRLEAKTSLKDTLAAETVLVFQEHRIHLVSENCFTSILLFPNHMLLELLSYYSFSRNTCQSLGRRRSMSMSFTGGRNNNVIVQVKENRKFQERMTINCKDEHN